MRTTSALVSSSSSSSSASPPLLSFEQTEDAPAACAGIPCNACASSLAMDGRLKKKKSWFERRVHRSMHFFLFSPFSRLVNITEECFDHLSRKNHFTLR